MFDEKQTFGLRKLSIGLASVLLAMSFVAAKPTGVQAAELEGNNVEQTEETQTAPKTEASPEFEDSASENSGQPETRVSRQPAYTGTFINGENDSRFSDEQSNQLNNIAKHWDERINSVKKSYLTGPGSQSTAENTLYYLENISGDQSGNKSINIGRAYEHFWSPGFNSTMGPEVDNIPDRKTVVISVSYGNINDSNEFEAANDGQDYHFWQINTPNIFVKRNGSIVDQTGRTIADIGDVDKSFTVTYSVDGKEVSEPLTDFLTKLSRQKLSDQEKANTYGYFPEYQIPDITDDQYIYTPYYNIDDEGKVYGDTIPSLFANRSYNIVIGYDKTRKQDHDKPTVPWTDLIPATPIKKTDPTPSIPWRPLTPATKIDNTDPAPEPQPTPEIPETPDHPEKPATSEKTAVEKQANKPAVHRTAKTVAKRQAVTRSRRAGSRVTPTIYRTAKANYRQASQPVNHIARSAASLPQTGNKNYVALGLATIGAVIGILGLGTLHKREN